MVAFKSETTQEFKCPSRTIQVENSEKRQVASFIHSKEDAREEAVGESEELSLGPPRTERT